MRMKAVPGNMNEPLTEFYATADRARTGLDTLRTQLRLLAVLSVVLVITVFGIGLPLVANAQTTGSISSVPVTHMRGFRHDLHAHMPGTRLPEHGRVVNHTSVTSNWSGYVDQACGSCALRYVSAWFTVPSINCAKSASNAYVSEWAGLDGWSDGTVEQTGIDAYCSNGSPQYFGWYEMFPSAPVVYSGPMNPGDAINANVYYNNQTQQWQLSLTDVSNGNYITADQPCPAGSVCSNNSAEVITEAPSFSNILPLADYGQMNYVDVQVTSRNGTHGDLAANRLWSVDSITMNDPDGESSIPGPVEGGQAFYVTFGQK